MRSREATARRPRTPPTTPDRRPRFRSRWQLPTPGSQRVARSCRPPPGSRYAGRPRDTSAQALIRASTRRLARTHQSALVGEDDGLDAVPQIQFREDVGQVGLDRRFANEETVTDLGVG